MRNALSMGAIPEVSNYISRTKGSIASRHRRQREAALRRRRYSSTSPYIAIFSQPSDTVSLPTVPVRHEPHKNRQSYLRSTTHKTYFKLFEIFTHTRNLEPYFRIPQFFAPCRFPLHIYVGSSIKGDFRQYRSGPV